MGKFYEKLFKISVVSIVIIQTTPINKSEAKNITPQLLGVLTPNAIRILFNISSIMLFVLVCKQCVQNDEPHELSQRVWLGDLTITPSIYN